MGLQHRVPRRGRATSPTLRLRSLGLTVALVALVVGSAPWTPSRPAAATELAVADRMPGPKVVDGVPLTPITTSERNQCQRFASRLGASVPCLGLLPVPIPVPSTYSGPPCLGEFGETACGRAAIQVSRSLFLLSQSNFEVPPGYVGVTFQQYNGDVVPMESIAGGPLGHFVFMAGTTLSARVGNGSRRGASPVPRYCMPQMTATPLRVNGATAKLYQCSDSGGGPGVFQLLMGHQLLVWKQAGITCEVSFHGISQVNVDLDLAVADSTRMVTAGSR
jgi:hypothetical protein